MPIHALTVGLLKILIREYNEFKKQDYENIKDISVAHIYNLRRTRQYKSHTLTFTKTQGSEPKYWRTKKTRSNGCPGYIRVDTVHQGDFRRKKGFIISTLLMRCLNGKM